MKTFKAGDRVKIVRGCGCDSCVSTKDQAPPSQRAGAITVVTGPAKLCPFVASIHGLPIDTVMHDIEAPQSPGGTIVSPASCSRALVGRQGGRRVVDGASGVVRDWLEGEGERVMDLGSRHANMRAAVASASAKLETLLEESRVPGGKVVMSPAVEDVIAQVHAALELILEDDANAS